MKNVLNKPIFHLLLIAAVGLIVYSNTFHSPFLYDEHKFIVGNTFVTHGHAVKDLKSDDELYKILKHRYVGFFTFAFNYKLHNIKVEGYHFFNLIVHILNALLLYLLISLTFKTPFLKQSNLRENSRHIAFFSSLFFVSHPVQTEAVTYIHQRLASLAALFYLLSLVSYIKSRLVATGYGTEVISKGSVNRHSSVSHSPIFHNLSPITYYLFSLVFIVLAMKTKENAFTLPLVITAYEFFFFRGKTGTRLLRLVPILMTLSIIPLTSLLDMNRSWLLSTKTFEDLSRSDYLFTEFRVIVTYLRLLFFPVNQNLDYDYRMYHSFIEPSVFLSFIFLLSIMGMGVYLFYRSRAGDPGLRVIAFGIFWFFMTLSVESSIIPIPAVINEYRVYLPSAGFFVSILSAIFLFLGRSNKGKVNIIVFISFIIIVFVFAFAAYKRNMLWQSEKTLWEDVIKKSPNKTRGYDNLAVLYYLKQKNYKEALKHLLIARKIKPTAKNYYNLALALQENGYFKEAITEYKNAVNSDPEYFDAILNLANALDTIGEKKEALNYYMRALNLNPRSPLLYYNLGMYYEQSGQFSAAKDAYNKALELDPNFKSAHTRLLNMK